jgi:hypothetical protein
MLGHTDVQRREVVAELQLLVKDRDFAVLDEVLP